MTIEVILSICFGSSDLPRISLLGLLRISVGEDESVSLDEKAKKAIGSLLCWNPAFPNIRCSGQFLKVIRWNPVDPLYESENS